MKVLKSNVLCKEIKSDSPTTKVGNFVIPDSEKGYIEAQVVTVGEEVKELHKDDIIYVYPNAGKEVKVNGEDYRVINVSEIILVI